MAVHTIRLRDPWERHDDSQGNLRLTRAFNAPTGISVSDHVYLVVESLDIRGSVLLNDQMLGPMAVQCEQFRSEISSLLRQRNQICIAIELPRDSPQASGLAPIVRLEIEDGASDS